jgi:hypothetical protein
MKHLHFSLSLSPFISCLTIRIFVVVWGQRSTSLSVVCVNHFGACVVDVQSIFTKHLIGAVQKLENVAKMVVLCYWEIRYGNKDYD